MKKTIILFLLFIGFAAINAQDVDVTFKVNMSVQLATGYFNPVDSGDVVTVAGGFNNWLNEPPENTTKVMSDDDGDGIYELTIAMAPETYEFKFNIGLGWDGKDETTGNRSITVAEAGETEVYWFNNQSANGDPANITFKVDMSVQQENGVFDPTAEQVFVAGNFNTPEWNATGLEMLDDDGDLVYEAVYDSLVGGQEIEFKFIQSSAASTDWETVDNRKAFIADGDNVYEAYWDNVEGGNFADGNITFNINMSVMEEVGIYDPSVDSIQIRGGFNGWGDSDPAVSKMSQNFLSPNEWFITIPFVATEVGGEQLFKYFVNKEDTTIGWEDGYERPLLQGGSNRPVEFEGTEDQNVPVAYYDDVMPNYVIEDGQTVAIKFSIDMTIAADPNEVALPFNSSTDTVWWICEQPSFVVTQGWEDSDEMRVLQMTDDDGDMIYTGTLEIKTPSWNGFEYRYGYGSPDNGFQSEPSGYGKYAYRVRYIEQAGARAFVQPYSAPVDTWQTAENKQSEWEEMPAGDITAVESFDATPSSFELAQNYPNPFNPTTMIKFSIPKSGMVSLKIHNVLGQEVASLVNKEMQAGTYEYSFNAANLSSGIYFYSIKTTKNVATKKMMLLK